MALAFPSTHWMNHLIILIIYLVIYCLNRRLFGNVKSEFGKSFIILYFGWALGTFFGNYSFYKLGYMSFIPWPNNFIHTFIWIGICLCTLYGSIYKKSIWVQIALFILYSFIIKISEFYILGSWELDNFVGIKFPFSYILGWSIMDGLYPFISIAGLWFVSKLLNGIIVPKLHK